MGTLNHFENFPVLNLGAMYESRGQLPPIPTKCIFSNECYLDLFLSLNVQQLCFLAAETTQYVKTVRLLLCMLH